MMRKLPPMLIATIPCALGLASCGNPRVEIVKPPVALTSCAKEPASPDLPAQNWSSADTAHPIALARDRMMLAYVLALRTWGGDCAGKVAGIRAWAAGVE